MNFPSWVNRKALLDLLQVNYYRAYNSRLTADELRAINIVSAIIAKADAQIQELTEKEVTP